MRPFYDRTLAGDGQTGKNPGRCLDSGADPASAQPAVTQLGLGREAGGVGRIANASGLDIGE